MSSQQYTCSKCTGKMIRGYAADRLEHYFMNLVWIDGEPENPEVFGIKGSNVVIGDKVRRIVRGLRCEKCDFVELYAILS